jgi:hypothetical protein
MGDNKFMAPAYGSTIEEKICFLLLSFSSFFVSFSCALIICVSFLLLSREIYKDNLLHRRLFQVLSLKS